MFLGLGVFVVCYMVASTRSECSCPLGMALYIRPTLVTYDEMQYILEETIHRVLSFIKHFRMFAML